MSSEDPWRWFWAVTPPSDISRNYIIYKPPSKRFKAAAVHLFTYLYNQTYKSQKNQNNRNSGRTMQVYY